MIKHISKSRRAISSSIYTLTQVLHEDGWKNLANDSLSQMWGRMQVIGEWVSGFTGIYFSVMMMKVLISIIITVFNIYKVTWLSRTLTFL